jgi:glycosyltransferase involved in cell wall biosynthesis
MSRHVLHIITGLVVGGAEMALYRLILQSRGSAYTHTVIALTPEGGMHERFRQAGIDLIVLDFRRSPITEFVRLRYLVRKIRPDIVQTWLYHADLLGGLAARMAGNRNVIWGIRTTDVDGGCSRATALIRQLCAWISGWVPHTIVCVAEAARRAHTVVGYDAGRMVVVANGFDLSRLTATQSQRLLLRMRCGFAADDLVVGTVGRFNADKDHANFVRAAGRLASRHGKVRFLMVGTDLNSDNRELMRWIADTGHPQRFVLLGERGDVPDCLAAMDIFCLSSRTEAFPNAVGEAMAMGLPCVATDVGDVAMLLSDTGVVVPKEDPDSLAAGVAGLLAMEPAARARLGQRARARIHAEFSMERAKNRFESIYEDVFSGRKCQCVASPDF